MPDLIRIGARGMQRIAASLEESGKRGETSETLRLVRELEEEFLTVRDLFQEHLKTLGPPGTC